MGDGVVDEELDGAGEDIERSGTVLALAHEDFARAILLAGDRAGKFVPDLFANAGKIRNGGQLVRRQEIPTQIRCQDYVLSHRYPLIRASMSDFVPFSELSED